MTEWCRLIKSCFVLGMMAASAVIVLPSASYAQDKEVELISPFDPPAYPVVANALGIDGYCEVRFAVDYGGRVFAVEPMCNHLIFCETSRKYVIGLEFNPALENGRPRDRYDIVLPLHFTFENRPETKILDETGLVPCEDTPIA